MKDNISVGWKAIRDDMLRRINAREFAPGAVLPNEAALARDYGCARATVNRALRDLAETGLLERRRKAGTVVVEAPSLAVRTRIPVIRAEIEATGAAYGYERLHLGREAAPPAEPGWGSASVMRVTARHLADGCPQLLEDRWISLAVPGVAEQAFDTISANEWLLANAPYSGGTMTVTAEPAGAEAARWLGLSPGDPVLAVERMTVDAGKTVTRVRLVHRPGHRITLSF
jgi:GntR family histidine utilization transcriptional repressor